MPPPKVNSPKATMGKTVVIIVYSLKLKVMTVEIATPPFSMEEEQVNHLNLNSY